MPDEISPEERRFCALANGTQERIAELDASGRTVYLSHEVAGLGDIECVYPEDRAEVARCFRTAYRDGTCQRTSYRIEEPDGSLRWYESSVSPFPGPEGTHVLVVSRDISDARRTEQELRDSRERFQRIAETAYDMIVECDAEWQIIYANERVSSILGIADTEVFAGGHHVHPDDLAETARVFKAVNKGESDCGEVTFRTQHSDGSWRWIETSLRLLDRKGSGEAGAPHVLAIGRDVTARLEAEQRLRESEQRYRDLVESAPLGIFVVQKGRVVYVNPAGARLLGASGPEAVHGIELVSMLSADDARLIAERMREASVDSRDDQIDFEIRGVDGRVRRVQGAANASSFAGAPAFQSILRDVSDLEEFRLQQERLQLQLQESRKLESLGVLAGGIAHDFNNLLAVVSSNVRYARDPQASDSDRDEALGDVEEAAERAARLVRQLLAYAGRREPEVRSVELSQLVESITDLLGTAVPKNVTLSVDLAREELNVHVDLVQLEQVLMNLVLNAAEALGDGDGHVTVRTARIRLEDGEISEWRGGGELAGGELACFEVEDDGAGMTGAVRARIFDPFFTTKASGHGLGLSAVLGMVQGHQGAIRVQSEPGRGTRIRIALPLEVGELRREVARRPLVLLAEANPEFRARLAALLDELDARVLEADGADSALGLYAMHGPELDAALIDADMATPDATPLASALHRSSPSLPIGLCLERPESLPPPLRALAATGLGRGDAEATLRERIQALLAKSA